jgi:hypothetical protein
MFVCVCVYVYLANSDVFGTWFYEKTQLVAANTNQRMVLTHFGLPSVLS